MLSWEEIERLAGIAIPPVVRTALPLEDRVIVVIEAPKAKTAGGLYKSEQTMAQEMGGSGWVLRAGPECHQLAAAVRGFKAAPPEPETVVGLHVCWGRYSGEALVVTDRDDEFRSRFRVLMEEHLLLVMSDNPSPNGEQDE